LNRIVSCQFQTEKSQIIRNCREKSFCLPQNQNCKKQIAKDEIETAGQAAPHSLELIQLNETSQNQYSRIGPLDAAARKQENARSLWELQSGGSHAVSSAVRRAPGVLRVLAVVFTLFFLRAFLQHF